MKNTVITMVLGVCLAFGVAPVMASYKNCHLITIKNSGGYTMGFEGTFCGKQCNNQHFANPVSRSCYFVKNSFIYLKVDLGKTVKMKADRAGTIRCSGTTLDPKCKWVN